LTAVLSSFPLDKRFFDNFYIENAAAADTASGANGLADGRAFFDEMG